MTVYNLLADLGAAGVKLWVEQGRLKYKAPKGALTLVLRDQIVEHKQAIISFLQQSRIGTEVQVRRIYPVARTVALPLSFAQERLWFLAQLEPDSSAYHIPLLLQLSGDVDRSMLERAMTALVKRHEILRTAFREVDRENSLTDHQGGSTHVEQFVKPAYSWALSYEDLSSYSAGERETRLQQDLEQIRTAAFDLSSGDLLRMVLFKLGKERYQLILTQHHIVTDAWSMSILIRELMSLYTAQKLAVSGEVVDLDSILPPLVIQYGDFAHWQRQWLQESEQAGQQTYWREHLADLPVLELPLDKPRPAVVHPRGDAIFFDWSPALQAQCQHFSQQQGVTLFMTLLAVFQILLSRYSGQNDFAVGTPIANRTLPEVEPLIGFFVNTLALRVRLDPAQSFETLIRQVQRTTLDAYANQDLPFEQVVEGLNLAREMSYTPLFQVMFSVQRDSDLAVEFPGMRLKTLPLSRRTSKFDLNLSLTESSEGLRGELEYNTDLFERSSIEQMLIQLEQLLMNLLAEPTKALRQISMMSRAQSTQLLSQWNAPLVLSSPATEIKVACQGIAGMFEEQVRCRPSALAVEMGSLQLTYDELNHQANYFARSLVDRGVQPDDVVVLCGARSVECLVALLAIVKVGGVYMPLETDQAPKRLALMIAQAQAAWAVVAADQAVIFSELAIKTVPLPVLNASIQNSENLCLESKPEGRFYIMFTSGSTGEPKGIVIPQRGVKRLVRDNAFLSLDSHTTMLHYAPLPFDASTFEIWGTLLNGGRLVVAPAGLLELERLGELIQHHQVNTLWLTAALFHAMAEHCLEGFSGLETLLAGGDQLNAPLVRRVLYRYPALTFINGYGPTENTTFTCCNVLHAADQVGRSVALGRPISGTQIYVLDEYLQPQAMGVPGELCVAGEGLALAYLPLLDGSETRAFTVNPFAALPGHGETLYCTGDRVRYLADGSLIFMGRIDQQVKIRGYRIELAEIESALLGLPWVLSCVVVVQESDGEKRLVAYWEGQYEKESEALAVRQTALIARTRTQLARCLPDYMQPAAHLIVDELPLNPNGKVDRKALKPAVFTRSSEQKTAPETALERALLSIWQRVLKIEEIGIWDNFFELGGHSLLATQISSRIRQELNYELPLRQLFAGATIAETAAWLTQHKQAGKRILPEQAIEAREPTSIPPASFSQRRLWLLEQLTPGSSAYLIPMVLKIQGPLDLAIVNRSINHLIARHESLRTAIVRDELAEGDVLQQHVLPAYSLTLSRETFAGELNRTSLQCMVEAELSKPFNLAQAPLFRIRLFDLGPADTLLMLSMHHIISDGWSMGVFVSEFTQLYQAFSEERSDPLPALKIQYADYALWQQRWMSDDTMQQALDFWLDQIAVNEPVLRLPTDYPRPQVAAMEGCLSSCTLSVALSQSLQALTEREGVSLFMLMLAAWELLLSRYSGQQQFNVGCPVAGRTVADTEPLIGFFVNTVVFGADLDEQLSFREFLYRISAQTLAGHSHQALPFEMLVDKLQPARSLSHSPLFQVFLNVLNLPSASSEVAGLRVEDLTADQQSFSAKFDLTLYVQPQEEGIKLSLLYRKDCFSEETIQQHLQHLELILSQLVTDPGRPLSDFQLLAEPVRSLLPDPNKPLLVQDFPLPHQQFSAHAKSYPKCTAMVDLDGEWTYGDLDKWSNQVAHALQRGGLKTASRVVIYGHRSGALVCALLGILKAGAAFSILDPSYPEARLRRMIAQLKPAGAIILSRGGQPSLELNALLKGEADYAVRANESGLNQRIGCSVNVPGLLDWQAHKPFSEESQDAPAAPVQHLDQLSYLMFTSGSAGAAKVIRGSLRPLAYLLDWYVDSFEVTERDHFSLLSGLAHDPLLRDIFVPLSVGATLHIPDPELMQSPPSLRQWMQNAGLTVCHLTPSMAQLVGMNADDSAACQSLRLMLFSGERLTAEHLGLMSAFAPAAALINCYGTTETPQIHSWHRLVSTQAAVLPVGQGTPCSQLLILDGQQRQVGRGELGEIYVRSPYLALGYDDPALNTDAFLTRTDHGPGLYRTGDYGRYVPEGGVEILGRHDQQVKIRGYRVELEEVAGAVTEVVGSDTEVVVLYQNGVSTTTKLVAYLVSTSPLVENLRELLRRVLPEYMVPAEYICIEKIPLTPNGKVDNCALEKLSISTEHTLLAPQTDTEIALAAIWAEVLQRPTVSITENFFELGGHSLLATRLLARIKVHFKVAMPLQVLFEQSTVETMADYIDTTRWARGDSDQAPVAGEAEGWEELEL